MSLRTFVLTVLFAGSLAASQPSFLQPFAVAQAPAAEKLTPKQEEAKALLACAASVNDDLKRIKIPEDRALRFQGKVQEATAMCRGGLQAAQFRNTPWVDWGNYWGTGDMSSLPKGFLNQKLPSQRGVFGALVDLEEQRVALIRFNLFDNAGTYQQYVQGANGVAGPALKVWPEMKLPPANPFFANVGGDGTQVCKGNLIRSRTVSGICNDVLNPAMGSAGMPFARNVEFETSFPDLGLNELTKNRHGDRLSLLSPDPQVISRKLFTRAQSDAAKCAQGYGLANGDKSANCDYKKAPFFNVLAAYWIQFMTHDWFSHLEEGHNDKQYMKVGCATKLVNGVETPLTPEEIAKLGCRPGDAIDKGYVAQSGPAPTFTANGKTHATRAPQTTANTNTAWWDASQIYGFDDDSRNRIQRDVKDPALLLLVPVAGQTGPGYLPVFPAGAPINPEWTGQESAAFPDNWTVGLSFLHNLFVREHNSFVTEFRKVAAKTPKADCGLRDPGNPTVVIRYQDVTPDELFEVARLVVAAEIAKIHTTEWTPQLLYDEPLYEGMNGNWHGLLGTGQPLLTKALSDVIVKNIGTSTNPTVSDSIYSVFASGPGIFGLGSKVPHFDITNPKYTNGGVNHFGSPFNFPEEFVSVYRLHPLVPDLLEYRDLSGDPNKIVKKVAVIDTFEAKATPAMQTMGIENWALTLGRQRLGLLTLHNSPMFLQNLKMGRLDSPTQQIDVVALDIVRDREHGVPRFNEFRRQYGLRQLTSYDDFIDPAVQPGTADWTEQHEAIATMREVYGTHVCDASKVITDAQVNDDGSAINDCLGHPNGSVIDNIEDVDTDVGYLAEYRRPHGFAISETQFVVFILNASRRLFSDRFFTSSFRPEFYTTLGVNWVTNNGPGGPVMERGAPNGHKEPVLPMKRVLLRNIPQLKSELDPVVNAFDPWARDRGEYYDLAWKPRKGAEGDDAFKP
jgi:hypothetical protein